MSSLPLNPWIMAVYGHGALKRSMMHNGNGIFGSNWALIVLFVILYLFNPYGTEYQFAS